MLKIFIGIVSKAAMMKRSEVSGGSQTWPQGFRICTKRLLQHLSRFYNFKKIFKLSMRLSEEGTKATTIIYGRRYFTLIFFKFFIVRGISYGKIYADLQQSWVEVCVFIKRHLHTGIATTCHKYFPKYFSW